MADNVELFSPSAAMTLGSAVATLGGFKQSDVPWQIWLMENPDSPISLPGKISLYNHDCLHILLDCGLSNNEEAFVVGFSMGTDRQTHWYHVIIFKLISRYFYPVKYRFTWQQLKSFELGYKFGELSAIRNLNSINFRLHAHKTVDRLRQLFGINLDHFTQSSG
jgi:hypothetical protein